MPNSGYQEIATLTRSVENVLRKVIRFLVGRISLVKLQEMVRFIYVEEAEDQLRQENPNKNVPLTKLALVTGLDTRTLTRTRNHESYRKPFAQKSSFLREFTPAAAILDEWGSNARFVDPTSGKPLKLTLDQGENSFASLFSESIKARGVTQQSILDRLEDSGAIRHNESEGTVELLKQSYLPTHTADQLGAFEMGYAAAANLMETIVHNFEAEEHTDKLYQRGVWTHRLPRSKRKELRGVLNGILESTEEKGREVLREFEQETGGPAQITAGISLFYFEDDVR